MTLHPILGTLLASAIVVSPVPAQQPCVTPAEAETLALVAMPAILQETVRTCAATLPASAFLRRSSAPLIAKYQVEADRAWPSARTALGKFVDPALAPLLATDLVRPMFTALLLSQIVGQIDGKDCPTIDRMASLLQPLPPKNTAGLIVTALQYLKGKQAKKGSAVKAAPDLPICEPRR